MKDKARLIDMAKNFAIVFLLISAGFLLYKATVSGQGSFFDRDSDSGTVELPENDFTSLASDPVFLLVTAKDGSHYAVKYNSDSKNKLIAQFSGSLGEALGSSGKPVQVSVETWQTALSESGVFFDYLYPQPLSAIASSLGTKVSSDTSLETARRFYLSENEENLVLYFISEDDGIIYRCDTALSFSTLETKISEYPVGNAKFAFELGDEYAKLDPYFIFSNESGTLREVAVTNPVRNGLDGSGLLKYFGMNSKTARDYPEPDGSVLYVDGDKSLRIQSSGKVLFQASENSGLPITGTASDLSIEDCISACGDIVKNSIGQTSGDGVASLVKALTGSTTSSERSFTISFGYFVNGIPVTLPGGESAASFQIISGTIVKAELYLRSYTLPGGTIVPLPEEQAAAIAKTQGGEPILTYEDKTDSVTCTWIRN